jgi:hypothetical protein
MYQIRSVTAGWGRKRVIFLAFVPGRDLLAHAEQLTAPAGAFLAWRVFPRFCEVPAVGHV